MRPKVPKTKTFPWRIFWSGTLFGVVLCVLVLQWNDNSYYESTSSLVSLRASKLPERSTTSLRQKKNKTQQESTKPPLACFDFLNKVRSRQLNVIDPNQGKNYTRWMDQTDHPFWASFHSKQFDRVRWGSYEQGHYYEDVQERAWMDILKQAPPNSCILDVGGNIGYYSLLSASMGPFVVDSFEPNMVNALRFCESLLLNGWKNEFEQPQNNSKARVNVNPYGISDKSGRLEFYLDQNPGASTFRKPKNVVVAKLGSKVLQPGQKRVDPSKVQYLDVMTLDQFAKERNWFKTRPRIEILKVDVERHEANVLLGAKELLKQQLIQNIFTETSLEDPDNKDLEIAALKLLHDSGYKLKAYGAWRGPSTTNTWPNDENLVHKILEDIENAPNREYLNLWWTL